MNTLARRLVVPLAVVLAVCVTASAAEPVIDIPDNAAQNALLDSHRKQIDEYVAYQIDKMASGLTREAVIKARGKLTGKYVSKGRAPEYMSAFAKSVSIHGKDMLAKLASGDALKALKEVNLAIIAKRMHQVPLQPLAVAMVSHKNPAVRMYGWQAYALMRTEVLAAGDPAVGLMYGALSNAMAKEQAPFVVAEMLKMFRLARDPADTSVISVEAYRQGQAKLFDILSKNWVGVCRRVIKADGAVVEGAGNGVVAITLLKGALKDHVDDKTAIQLVANVTWSAGKAYDLALRVRAAAEAVDLASENAEQLAAKAGVKAKDLVSKVQQSKYAVSAARLLLTECEKALNSLTTSNERHIRKPLGKSSSKDPAAGVRLGVLAWIDQLVDDNGIKRPEEVVPAKATDGAE